MGNFCYKTANIMLILGYVIIMIKIVVPILIIILGIIDMAKAFIANDDKAINKNTITLVKRVIAGVIIFFIPTLISYAFTIIGSFDDVEEDYMNCVKCLTKPSECDTSYSGEIFKF